MNGYQIMSTTVSYAIKSVSLFLKKTVQENIYPGKASYSQQKPTRLPDLLLENSAMKAVERPTALRVTLKPFFSR